MKNPITHTRTRRWLVAIVLSVVSVQAALAGTTFSKVVVFGDSLNDRGNMVQFTNGVFPAPPTYAYGRQSNGPVWVEYLANRLSLGNQIANYAVVGALTKPAPGFPTGNVWSDTFPGLEGTDVTTQVLDYLADAGGTADPAALYILEGGANDFPRVANPAVIVSNLLTSLVTLEMKGAKHILLVNLPDIGKTPRVIIGESQGALPPGTGVFVSGACAQLNQGLVAALPAYTLPGVTITVADTYGFLNQAAANPAAFGLVNVQGPFLYFGNGGNPAQWLFWDDLHPTTRGHEIFAGFAADSLGHRYYPGDTTPPVIHGLTVTPGLLGVPNGQMVDATVTANTSDNADPAPASRIVSVTSNQPGMAGTDYVLNPFTPLKVQLRSITTGPSLARVYTLTVECRDLAGNASLRALTVTAAPLPPSARR